MDKKMISLTIDNIPVIVPEGTTILEAARSAGIKIPSLCYLKDVNEIGACRICVVEVKGARSLMASCVYPVSEGMEVKTSDGVEIGRVDELSFDERTGELNSLFLDDGATSRALLGSIEIPAALMVGYKKGILIVKPEARDLMPSGGLAAKAGEASAKVSTTAAKSQAAATEATAKAIESGTVAVGKGVGRIKNSVTGAVDGFKRESGMGEKKKAASPEGSKAPATTKTTTKSASSSSSKKTSTSASAKKAVTNHLKSAGSMFSDFKKEYDKAKK